MAGTRQAGHHRAVSEPEQRELIQQHQHIRRFEIFKSTPLGLIFPQNCQLELREVDAGIKTTSQSTNASSGSAPTYVTSEMQWWKVKWWLPPTFEVFPSNPIPNPQTTSPDGETTGLSSSPALESQQQGKKPEKPWPLATIKFPGWEGMTKVNIDMTIYEISKWMTYDHTLHAPSDIRSRWSISRVGWQRTYVMACIPGTPETGIYKWRGSKTILDIPEMDDGFKNCSGNLKLEDEDARLIAVYKQRRDWEVMGSLTIFLDNMKENLPIEAVVGSCLAVVMYERLGFQNLLGN